jgi:hypothetical protein
VFENRVLRIFGLKGEEVTGAWRKLHNKNGHVKRWAGHVARMGRRGMRIDTGGKQGVGGWTILKWILERWDGKLWIILI